MDIAELGYKIDPNGLQAGVAGMKSLTTEAGRAESASGKFEKQVQRLAVSQKQLAMANRQLPMQFTDIAVSLQAGMNPMQVLLQQGTQIRDMYGGLGPALRSSGRYMMGLVNPATLAAGALVVLATAYSQLEERQNAINRSLIRTGRFSEQTAEDLRELAEEMDDIAGVTAGSASRAIAEVAATGRFSKEQLEIVARAAETWRAASGDAISDVVKDFAKLKGDPVDAALELNRSYGFLTASVLEQITALEEQGRTSDATDMAIRSLAGTLERRAPQMAEQVGSIASAFRGLEGAASEAWDGIVEGMDGAFDNLVEGAQRYGTLTQKVAAMTIRLLQANGGKGAKPAAGTGATEPAVDSDAIELARKAAEKWDRLTLANLSKEQRLAAEIADIRKTGAAAKKSEAAIEIAIADARARYTESLRKAKTIKSDPTAGIVERLQKQIALNQEQALSTEALTATERQLLGIEVELANLGAKVAPGRRAEIEALMAKARATDEAAQAAEKARVAEEALVRLRERVGLAEQNQRRGNAIELLGMGRGADATEMLRRQLELHRWYEDQVAELRRQAALEKRAVTAGEELELQASLQRQLEEERRYQEQRRRLMGDWTVGASSALQNYLERSRDVASQVEEIWTNAFNTLEDIGVDALSGNLQSWGDYFDDLHQMILRFLVRQQLSKWLESLSAMGASTSVMNPISGAMVTSGGGASSWITSLLGALSGGQRALGGDMRGDRIYQVGERNRPELANIGGKQWLIPGDRGNVEPIRNSGRGQPAVNVYQTFNTEGRIDPRTAAQMQVEAGIKTRMAIARNN